VLGFCCATVGALYPDLSSIWTARPDRAVGIIADHEGVWEFANWMFAVDIGATLGGLAMLARYSIGPRPGRRFRQSPQRLLLPGPP
jgi:hypothetical protein